MWFKILLRQQDNYRNSPRKGNPGECWFADSVSFVTGAWISVSNRKVGISNSLRSIPDSKAQYSRLHTQKYLVFRIPGFLMRVPLQRRQTLRASVSETLRTFYSFQNFIHSSQLNISVKVVPWQMTWQIMYREYHHHGSDKKGAHPERVT